MLGVEGHQDLSGSCEHRLGGGLQGQNGFQDLRIGPCMSAVLQGGTDLGSAQATVSICIAQKVRKSGCLLLLMTQHCWEGLTLTATSFDLHLPWYTLPLPPLPSSGPTRTSSNT